MTSQETSLPNFAKPPVVEVALSVLYESIPRLTSARMGALWQKLRGEFPETEDHQPLPFVTELHSLEDHPPGPSLRPVVMSPAPRAWFVKADGTELIQLQNDRFAFNWRKREPSDVYPRYPTMRDSFERNLGLFRKFLEEEKLGPFQPRQCEVTYVNHIAQDGDIDLAPSGDIVSLWKGSSGVGFLPKEEAVQFSARYVIPDSNGQFLGRLHVSLKPAKLKATGQSILVMTITARGEPTTERGIFGFLDLGREWIVKGFNEITAQQMHKAWGELDE